MKCEFSCNIIDHANTSSLCVNGFASLEYVSVIIWFVLESQLARACVSAARERYK